VKSQTVGVIENTEKIKKLEDLLVHEDISIPIGTDVQMEIGGVDFKMQSKIIGAVHNVYLIFKTPSPGNLISINTKLYAGNRVTVRYLHNGTVYGFQSELISAINEPAKLIFVSYPKIIASRDLRSHKRLKCCIPAKTRIKGAEYNTIIRDIGITGCRLLLKYPCRIPRPALEVGESISSTVEHYLSINEHKLEGEIKNISIDQHKIYMGVCFKKIDEKIQESINKYISIFFEF